MELPRITALLARRDQNFYTVNLSSWPIPVLTYTGTAETDEAMHAHMQIFNAIYEAAAERKEKIVLVTDMNQHGGKLSTPHRKITSDWLAANAALIRNNALGCVLLIPDAVTRLMMTAIFFVSPMPTEYKVFRTMGEAFDWASQKFAAAGKPLPSGLLAKV